MSDREQFAQVAQKEWAIMSESLRLLTKNEQMCEFLTFWANSSFTHFFWQKRVIRSEIRWANSQPWTERSPLFHEYLREKESFSKTIVACLSGAPVG